MKHLTLVALAAGLLAAGCSIRTERVVERPAPVPPPGTVVYTDAPPATATVYTTR